MKNRTNLFSIEASFGCTALVFEVMLVASFNKGFVFFVWMESLTTVCIVQLRSPEAWNVQGRSDFRQGFLRYFLCPGVGLDIIPLFYCFNRSAAYGAPRYGTTGYEYVGLACTRVSYFLSKYLVLRHLFFGLPWVGRIRKAKNKAAGLSNMTDVENREKNSSNMRPSHRPARSIQNNSRTAQKKN